MNGNKVVKRTAKVNAPISNWIESVRCPGEEWREQVSLTDEKTDICISVGLKSQLIKVIQSIPNEPSTMQKKLYWHHHIKDTGKWWIHFQVPTLYLGFTIHQLHSFSLPVKTLESFSWLTWIVIFYFTGFLKVAKVRTFGLIPCPCKKNFNLNPRMNNFSFLINILFSTCSIFVSLSVEKFLLIDCMLQN